MSSLTAHLRGTCGCCQPPAPATPLRVHNRPALDAVDYRIGTYASFRQAMLQHVGGMAAELAAQTGLPEPPLAGWTSRQPDDHGIALLEMWATIGDILTFYAERYANEAWLRTAVHRDAVRRLAGLLGYRLNPGVAAATHLAWTLDDGVALTLPAGLRVQSVPREGERPQKFETVAALEADAALNAVRVHGPPATVTPLAAGRGHATLVPDTPVPVAGDAVVLFTDDGAGGIEERTVEAVDAVDGRQVLRWSAPLAAAHGRAHVRDRAFRLFGHAAPATQVVATPQGPATAPSVRWQTATTNVAGSTSGGLDLDGTVDGLEAGSQVLVVAAGVARRRSVQSVTHVTATVSATMSGGGTATVMTGAATRLTLAGPSFEFADRRTVRVYELTEALTFLGWELPRAPIPAGTTTVFLPRRDVQALAAGRRLVVDDDAGDPFLVEVAEDAETIAVGGAVEFLVVELVAGLPRALDAASARLHGNVAPATHGETVHDEVLGDGDAAEALQEFTLAKDRVTHVADLLAAGGARSTVEVLVDRVRWRARSGLYGARPTDRVYTLEVDDEQRTHVRFGDGVRGARLPSGRANIVATYRQGLGAAGNLAAGQLATLLDRPTGVSGVTNPLPVAGGVDPETLASARENAPNTVRTFDRVVSLRDFADLAREYTGVEKALATWVWDGQERVVHVTVGGEDAAELTDEQLAAVRAYLDQRRDPNRALRLDRYRPVPFRVAVAVVAEPDRFNDDVRQAVEAEIVAYFAYDNRRFGQAVHLSDVYAAVHEAAGVVGAVIGELRYKRSADRVTHGAAGVTVAVHAPVFAARHGRPGRIVPAELACLDDPADAAVTVTGGLEA